MAEVLVSLVSVPAPDMGEIVQVTPLPDVSLFTWAVICAVPPAPTVPAVVEMDTEMGGGGGGGGGV